MLAPGIVRVQGVPTEKEETHASIGIWVRRGKGAAKGEATRMHTPKVVVKPE